MINYIKNYKNIKNAEIEFIKVVAKERDKDYRYNGYRYNYWLEFKVKGIYNNVKLDNMGILISEFYDGIGLHSFRQSLDLDLERLERINKWIEKFTNGCSTRKYIVLKSAYELNKDDIKYKNDKNRMKQLIDEIPVEYEENKNEN